MLSLRALPLIALAMIIYNAIAFLGGSGPAHAIFDKTLVDIPMLRGGAWRFTLGDLVLAITLLLLFVEIVKSTYTSSSALVDHALSMIVFIICGIEFLLVEKAGTSLFFFITFITLIDVVAGYTIGIRVARRDFQIGGDS